MNKFLSRLTPEWSLRLGLGLMYVYSGIDILRHPTAWHWAVRPLLKWFPASIQATLSQSEVMNRYLLLQGIVELVLAVILLAWFLPKFWVSRAAFITILEFAGILLLIPVDAITFRDIGLLGAALALWHLLKKDVLITSVEKYAPEGLKRVVDHTDVKPGEPKVETFDEFMGT